MTTTTRGLEGQRYQETKTLSLKEITAMIRKEAREAVAEWNAQNGAIGKTKVSVTMPHYGAIYAEIRVTGDLWALYKKFGDYAYANRLRDRVEELEFAPEEFKPLVKLYELKHAIEAIRGQYNYNNSDIQTDYFDVRYYGSTDIRNEQGGWA